MTLEIFRFSDLKKRCGEHSIVNTRFAFLNKIAAEFLLLKAMAIFTIATILLAKSILLEIYGSNQLPIISIQINNRFWSGKIRNTAGILKKCEVLTQCNGECPKNRFIVSPDGEERLNYLCAGYRMFFNHCRPFIEEIRKAAILGV